MNTTVSHSLRQSLAIVAAAALFTACTDETPTQAKPQAATPARSAESQARETDADIAALRRATDRYHELDVAIKQGFVLLHPCENRPGEGPVGIVYVHLSRLMDGIIDPSSPDALIYEPSSNGHPTLVGAEFAIPYPLWTSQEPPKFHGATFQREDEFGVFGLHAWIWRENPKGLFAETNPRVSCGVE